MSLEVHLGEEGGASVPKTRAWIEGVEEGGALSTSDGQSQGCMTRRTTNPWCCTSSQNLNFSSLPASVEGEHWLPVSP